MMLIVWVWFLPGFWVATSWLEQCRIHSSKTAQICRFLNYTHHWIQYLFEYWYALPFFLEHPWLMPVSLAVETVFSNFILFFSFRLFLCVDIKNNFFKIKNNITFDIFPSKNHFELQPLLYSRRPPK